MNFDEAVADFLAQKKIAVAGLSRKGDNPGNHIAKKLAGSGMEIFGVHPSADKIDGFPCFPDLASLPAKVDGVMITTHPKITEKIVEDCVVSGIPRVWLHRSFGEGSVSEKAVEICKQNNIAVIAGGCPMMFAPPVDIVHKCMCWILKKTGGLPKMD